MAGSMIGLTGPIGAGKSTVAALLRARGAAVIDVDSLAREEQLPGSVGYAAIVEHFGRNILEPDLQIDRARLAAIVFGDPAELRQLEAILHPRIVERILEARSSVPDIDVLVVEAVKIIGGPIEALCEQMWVVLASRESIVARLQQHRGMNEAAIASRLAQQLDHDAFRARADVVIENDGDRLVLADQVDRAWHGFVARAMGAVRARDFERGSDG